MQEEEIDLGNPKYSSFVEHLHHTKASGLVNLFSRRTSQISTCFLFGITKLLRNPFQTAVLLSSIVLILIILIFPGSITNGVRQIIVLELLNESLIDVKVSDDYPNGMEVLTQQIEKLPGVERVLFMRSTASWFKILNHTFLIGNFPDRNWQWMIEQRWIQVITGNITSLPANTLVMGKSIATDLDLNIGDRINVITGEKVLTNGTQNNSSSILQIGGLFSLLNDDVGEEIFASWHGYFLAVSLETLEALSETENQINLHCSLNIRLNRNWFVEPSRLSYAFENVGLQIQHIILLSHGHHIQSELLTKIEASVTHLNALMITLNFCLLPPIILSLLLASFSWKVIIERNKREIVRMTTQGIPWWAVLLIYTFQGGIVGVIAAFLALVSSAILGQLFLLFVLKIPPRIDGIITAFFFQSWTLVFIGEIIATTIILISIVPLFRRSPHDLLSERFFSRSTHNFRFHRLDFLIGGICFLVILFFVLFAFVTSISVTTGLGGLYIDPFTLTSLAFHLHPVILVLGVITLPMAGVILLFSPLLLSYTIPRLLLRNKLIIDVFQFLLLTPLLGVKLASILFAVNIKRPGRRTQSTIILSFTISMVWLSLFLAGTFQEYTFEGIRLDIGSDLSFGMSLENLGLDESTLSMKQLETVLSQLQKKILDNDSRILSSTPMVIGKMSIFKDTMVTVLATRPDEFLQSTSTSTRPFLLDSYSIHQLSGTNRCLVDIALEAWYNLLPGDTFLISGHSSEENASIEVFDTFSILPGFTNTFSMLIDLDYMVKKSILPRDLIVKFPVSLIPGMSSDEVKYIIKNLSEILPGSIARSSGLEIQNLLLESTDPIIFLFNVLEANGIIMMIITVCTLGVIQAHEVRERRTEITLLRSRGVSRFQALSILVVESISMSVLGLVVGGAITTIVGLLILFLVSRVVLFQQLVPGVVSPWVPMVPQVPWQAILTISSGLIGLIGVTLIIGLWITRKEVAETLTKEK